MKRLAIPLLLLAAACQDTMERAPRTWHPAVEILCHERACPRCHGSSLQPCAPCRAKGKVPCTTCKDGKLDCRDCKGDGKKDGKKCKPCEGSGRVNCRSCGGTRMAPCGHCDGKAKHHCLRVLEVRDTPPLGDDAWPPGNAPDLAPR